VARLMWGRWAAVTTLGVLSSVKSYRPIVSKSRAALGRIMKQSNYPNRGLGRPYGQACANSYE
jgi:hypothetical protein